MVTIARSQRFEDAYKRYVKRNIKRAESIIKALQFFVNDPNHPSLNIEKLKGSKVWSMRLSQSDRLFFLWIDEHTVLLLDIGSHDKYRAY